MILNTLTEVMGNSVPCLDNLTALKSVGDTSLKSVAAVDCKLYNTRRTFRCVQRLTVAKRLHFTILPFIQVIYMCLNIRLLVFMIDASLDLLSSRRKKLPIRINKAATNIIGKHN